MNWLPSLAAWPFALAGVAGAAATIAIHLINWHRQRVIEWAATDFLRAAIQRHRRVVQVRDLLLVALRAAAVLLFGLALARPHFAASDQLAGLRPIHAIVIIDNSLSMSGETSGGSLLDQACEQARELCGRLSEGSLITILPACQATPATAAPLTSVAAAITQIDQIAAVDASARLADVLAAAHLAATRASNLPAEAVFFTDQQAITWEDLPAAPASPALQSLQVVDVAPPRRDNTWVAELQIEDGFAMAHAPTRIEVVVQRHGGSRLRDVEVVLDVDGQPVAAQPVRLTPAEPLRRLTFHHNFAIPAGTAQMRGQPAWATVSVQLTPDRLPMDDQREAIVPLLPEYPVLLVDQYGEGGEDLRRGRVGETLPLRKLLAAALEDRRVKSSWRPAHRTIDELAESELRNIRLVVLAGIEQPGDQVALLRRYVESGGQLLIAAGGDFDPESWNTLAWLDGQGILPLPLRGKIGQLPQDTTGPLAPRWLDVPSFVPHLLLELPGSSLPQRHDLFSEPLFFQAVAVDESVIANSESAEEDATRDDTPRVLARFSGSASPACLIEKSIGRGRVVLFTSGLRSEWNTLAQSSAIVLLDRITRTLIGNTLAPRNHSPQAALPVPLPRDYSASRVALWRPDQVTPRTLPTTALEDDTREAIIASALSRGVYRLAPVNTETSPTEPPAWLTAVAINGASDESRLAKVSDAAVAELAKTYEVRAVDSGQHVSLGGTQAWGDQLWWWLAVVVLILVVVELAILAGLERTVPASRTVGASS